MTKLTLVAALFGAATAHMIMKTPVPFGVDTLNNSPLVDAAIGSSGSDYPCKLRTGVYDISTMNNMTVGENQVLSFTGSASHGGGTCMLAYTTDKEPDAKTQFKLFQTFQGGCPIQADGNDGSKPFNFKLPEGTPNGRLTMAWIWYNRIGNREIYMNCAPLEVTGGSDNMDFYNSLPNAYIINLPTSECTSIEGSNLEIPFPGQYIEKDNTSPAAAASGSGCAKLAAAMTQGVSGYHGGSGGSGSAGGSSAASYGSAPTSSAAGSYAPAPTSSAGSYNQPSSASKSGFTTVPSKAPAYTASSYAPAMPSAAPSAAPNGGSGSGNSTNTGSCKGAKDGTIVCNGKDQFGLCNGGSVAWQPVSPGTSCNNGIIQKRGDVRHAHPHGRAHWHKMGVAQS
ncbi:lytic polysaccharide monooxygenase [Piedraia hortae CBS 480.64]|uniref:Lytic polysaccharide monooxygenase n=1 Tax=Piedraia hortae CBS 480.64 TaxID=1314780 RepID=A0A6A7C5M0_9PEZI|nr:lytic polysaccharide monooxygenase [Piedraia hortae CBS 480.64]